MSNGLFCSIVNKMHNKIIEKVYHNSNILSDLWFKLPLSQLLNHIKNYNENLNKSGVNTPLIRGLKLVDNRILIIQELIVGSSVRNIIKSYCNDFELVNQSLNYFKKLIEMQVKAFMHYKDLRIDLNPDNFIINRNKIYLIDITPPLYSNIIEYEGNDIIILRYLTLCFNIKTQVAELICNWLKPLLKNQNLILSKLTQLEILMDKLVSVAIECWISTDLEYEIKKYFTKLYDVDDFEPGPESYPLKRLLLIKLLCGSKISFKEFKYQFEDLAFMPLIRFR